MRPNPEDIRTAEWIDSELLRYPNWNFLKTEPPNYRPEVGDSVFADFVLHGYLVIDGKKLQSIIHVSPASLEHIKDKTNLIKWAVSQMSYEIVKTLSQRIDK